MNKSEQKNRLNQLSLDIEFLLISVIQGMALSVLASSAIEPLKMMQFEYWPYILASFLLILLFWSQAIVHAISFISWPISLMHSFLYFLIGFIEVIAFSEISNPQYYFLFMTVFSLVAAYLYWVDLKLMKAHVEAKKLAERTRIDQSMIAEHIREMKTSVPMGILFNALMAWIIFSNPVFFIEQKNHIYLGIILTIIFGLILIQSGLNFKKRTRLLNESW